MWNRVPTMNMIPAALLGSLLQGAPLGLLRLPLWCGGWQAHFIALFSPN